jgi:VIT1/CCC1 family predicted Fe2+/Mn2+ transporter
MHLARFPFPSLKGDAQALAAAVKRVENCPGLRQIKPGFRSVRHEAAAAAPKDKQMNATATRREPATPGLPYKSAHVELHYINRSGWLRAAVLGANDGIVSVSSLVVGVAAADPNPSSVLIAGFAGLAAGAMSMAAGEYVSVSSQSDIEQADIARERQAIIDTPDAEEAELVSIFESRGLSPATAALVASELTAKDALGAHVREELGLSEVHTANPLQAAFASGLTFCVAASLPVAAAMLAPEGRIIPSVVITTLVALAGLGALGAHAGAAPKLPATLRVLFWGAAAMAITAGVGHFFGVSV